MEVGLVIFCRNKSSNYINIIHEGRIRLRMLLMGHLIFMISGSVGRVQLKLQFQKQRISSALSHEGKEVGKMMRMRKTYIRYGGGSMRLPPRRDRGAVCGEGRLETRETRGEARLGDRIKTHETATWQPVP